MHRFYSVLLLIISLTISVKSQSNATLGLLPSINISKKLPKDWSLHAKAETRLEVYSEEFDFEYQLTDLSLLAGRKVSLNTSLSAGYQIRFRQETISNRTIQQITYVKRYTGFRLSHRFAADQTFQKQEYAEYRFRYRISSEFALQGQSVDPGEFFVKLNNEYLYSLQGQTDDLEIRLGAFGGYSINHGSKLELGMDYRTDSFIDNNIRHRMWIGINFYQTLQ
jgi:hypothetical protein